MVKYSKSQILVYYILDKISKFISKWYIKTVPIINIELLLGKNVHWAWNFF